MEDEATTIGDPFQHHSQDAFIVKETLTNRQILMREFIQAQEQGGERETTTFLIAGKTEELCYSSS